MSDIRLKNPPGYNLDVDVLRVFEKGLDPRYPENGSIPARVLGYGEISTVFSIEQDGFEGLAFKRLPIFYTLDELDEYLGRHEQYDSFLSEAGLYPMPHGYAGFTTHLGRPIVYLIQHRRPAESIGHRAIHLVPGEQVPRLLHILLGELSKIWKFNQPHDGRELAVDAQFSNWAIEGFDASHP